MRNEHGVDPECGCTAEDGSDIGMVRDVLEHGYSSSVVANFLNACGDGAPEGSESTARELETGQLFELPVG